MNSLISSPCDSVAEELDAGDQEPRLGAFDGFLEVFGETSVASEPCERPFDDPSSGQQHEALAVSERLTISSVQVPSLARASVSFGPA